ncbi:23S rRNA (cytidine2498-2'-O)-methyltransferase [Methylomagnum ishizawai]|uniref:Ribosomal RNA large subunit methyltransferase M n=1 Tax=Methylomagnum ishizawai TaxID=1760988 RepID=A0A1Y6D1S6_9GAMM|nr:23S rRNA (cytidine(2498)-2'-O)-methyltransferase RlmM [Methylomagnum ishizawai]SMF96360.1 23S rRNA (cytidine2498-2'-O)-methyltransferase [Methylomagnum ishizawai]
MNPSIAPHPAPKSSPDCLLLYCRGGFEKECAAEIIDRALALGVSGYVKAKPDSGYVVFVPNDPKTMAAARRLRWADLIFARQLIFASGPLTELPPEDRVTPLLEQVRGLAQRFSDCWLETADTNEAKELSVFVRKFAVPFRKALEREALLGGSKTLRLHVFFLDSATAYVGVADPHHAAPWPMGIPRLKAPRSAPSRSTLKLEEAFLVFVADPEQDLKPAMTAVDLGAAPGGWTWQLVRRHIRTTAIDNGPLDPALFDTGIVEHLRVDGFRYRPPKPVDWLVCDMVEQPARIAALIAEWLAQGHCRHAIFNLKLPMKKRYEEVGRCREIIAARLDKAGIDYRLAFKQLYHDRAEITGYLTLDRR